MHFVFRLTFVIQKKKVFLEIIFKGAKEMEIRGSSIWTIGA